MEAGNVGSASNGAKKRFRSNASSSMQPVGNNGLSFKTPAVSRLGGKPPMTTRTARKGEVIKS